METLTDGMADSYEAGALEGGHQVRRQNIPEMKFDPILHKGYREIQPLEPDLQTFQENVTWADHVVFFYPNWWGTMPAPLKGLIDRAWLPGFAFHFHHDDLWWDKLLKGKSGRVIVLANVHPWISWFLFGEFTNELARATLGFAGISPVKVKVFYPSERASDFTRAKWFLKVRLLGKEAR